jgi:hypothetical protein
MSSGKCIVSGSARAKDDCSAVRPVSSLDGPDFTLAKVPRYFSFMEDGHGIEK